jgi:hypothetical protein
MSDAGEVPDRGGLFPVPVKRALWLTVGALLLAATYLVAVRGSALLVDLAVGAAGLFCL